MRINLNIAFHMLNLPALAIFLLVACNADTTKKDPDVTNTITATPIAAKPPSSFNDTVTVYSRAVVFYRPDSIQLNTFRQISSNMVYETTTHEGFYQMRNARIVLKKYWPQLRVIEAENIRYLVFVKNGKGKTVIDLNTNGNLYGMYMFDPQMEPQVADMMNVETAMGFYFK